MVASIAGVQNNFGILDMVTAKIQTFADSVTAYLKDKPDESDAVLQHSETAANKYSSLSTDYSNVVKPVKPSSTTSISKNNTPVSFGEDFFHTFDVKDVDVPTVLREPYILTGYMIPDKPLRYYLKTIYLPSNELLNVWTHLIPGLYFAWLLYKFSVELDPYRVWPLLVMTAAAMTVLLCSAVAHTFHGKSAHFHRCCFTLDYYGISIFAYASTVMKFIVCSETTYFKMFATFNILVLTINCFIGFFCCCVTQSQQGMFSSVKAGRILKMLCNLLGYLYGAMPVFWRLYVFGYADDPGMHYLIWEFVFFFICPFWYFSDLPQKIWPGKFDFIGHSHQIFHLCSAAACYCMVSAVYCDVTHPQGTWSKLITMESYPDYNEFSSYLYTLLVLMAICGVLFMVKSKEEEVLETRKSCCGSSDEHKHASIKDKSPLKVD